MVKNFEVGQTYHIYNDGNYKIHIVAIVDDCQIVYKWHGRVKQWWHYAVEDASVLEERIKYAERKAEQTA